jgi:hypothetical protein
LAPDRLCQDGVAGSRAERLPIFARLGANKPVLASRRDQDHKQPGFFTG